jgi:hypothetical protein
MLKLIVLAKIEIIFYVFLFLKKVLGIITKKI